MKNSGNFHKRLLTWYLINHRDLPWRQTNNPYLIWVSEIILQQTRVNQGLDYYKRFIGRFPDVHALAESDEIEVLKLWEGLGYYSRARNMHATARHVVSQLNGSFPEKYEELLKLKGIGKYSAAAIASIAFNKAVAVVDGNVLRFFSRFFGIEKPVNQTATAKEVTDLANQLIKKNSPGMFNQAVMEFGALQCVPVKPDCNNCCFSSDCVALKSGKVDLLPFKEKKKKVAERFFNYLVILSKSDAVVVKKRGKGDIWQHLYDFPLIESNELLEVKQLVKNETFRMFFNGNIPEAETFKGNYRHLLTHRIIHARFFRIVISNENMVILPENYLFANNLRDFPLPKLINRFLEDHWQDHQQSKSS